MRPQGDRLTRRRKCLACLTPALLVLTWLGTAEAAPPAGKPVFIQVQGLAPTSVGLNGFIVAGDFTEGGIQKKAPPSVKSPATMNPLRPTDVGASPWTWMKTGVPAGGAASAIPSHASAAIGTIACRPRYPRISRLI